MHFENLSGGNTAKCATTEGLRISKLRQYIGGYLGTDATLDVTWVEEGKKRPRTETMIPSRFIGREHVQFKCGTTLLLEQITEVK